MGITSRLAQEQPANQSGTRRLLACAWLMSLAGLAAAQESVETPEPPLTETQDERVVDDQVLEEPAADTQTRSSDENREAARGSRVVSLQTTVTGNQEQPRVLYIIPWQSPRASDADFEQFDGLQTPVFGHVERDEFRRELEARGEFD